MEIVQILLGCIAVLTLWVVALLYGVVNALRDLRNWAADRDERR